MISIFFFLVFLADVIVAHLREAHFAFICACFVRAYVCARTPPRSIRTLASRAGRCWIGTVSTESDKSGLPVISGSMFAGNWRSLCGICFTGRWGGRNSGEPNKRCVMTLCGTAEGFVGSRGGTCFTFFFLST